MIDEFLLDNETVILRKGANILISREQAGLNKLGPLGVDSEMQLVGSPRGHESIGGRIYLTNYRLFFRSHKMNRVTGTLGLFLPAIISMRDSSKFIRKILDLTTSNHSYSFIVWGVAKLISSISTARDDLKPEQIEAVRKELASSPEKLGDGLNIFPPEIGMV